MVTERETFKGPTGVATDRETFKGPTGLATERETFKGPMGVATPDTSLTEENLTGNYAAGIISTEDRDTCIEI